MAEVTSGDRLTVIVIDENETNALKYLLEHVSLKGNDSDEWALKHTYSVLEALDLEVTD